MRRSRTGPVCLFVIALSLATTAGAQDGLRLGERGYLTEPGLNVIVFDDIYPDGHQTGVTIIQHGSRVAARRRPLFSPSPTQQQSREQDR